MYVGSYLQFHWGSQSDRHISQFAGSKHGCEFRNGKITRAICRQHIRCHRILDACPDRRSGFSATCPDGMVAQQTAIPHWRRPRPAFGTRSTERRTAPATVQKLYAPAGNVILCQSVRYGITGYQGRFSGQHYWRKHYLFMVVCTSRRHGNTDYSGNICHDVTDKQQLQGADSAPFHGDRRSRNHQLSGIQLWHTAIAHPLLALYTEFEPVYCLPEFSNLILRTVYRLLQD